MTSIEGLSESVSSSELQKARTTIRQAGLIDANAELIAASGGGAQQKILEITGDKPSTGFNNESASAIRQRAQVILSAWSSADTQEEKVQFIKSFSGDPCIAARLNNVTEYLARRTLGVSASELVGAQHDLDLAIQIGALANEFFGENDPNWAEFRLFLERDHAAIFNHPKFEASYSYAKLAI